MKRIIRVLCIVIFIFAIATSCVKTEAPLTVAELLDLGEKYLLELNYEQALVQFLKVIDVEPMNPRGYTGAAEVYVHLEQPEKAIGILEQGKAEIGDNESIVKLLDEIQQADNAATVAAVPQPEPTPPPMPLIVSSHDIGAHAEYVILHFNQSVDPESKNSAQVRINGLGDLIGDPQFKYEFFDNNEAVKISNLGWEGRIIYDIYASQFRTFDGIVMSNYDWGDQEAYNRFMEPPTTPTPLPPPSLSSERHQVEIGGQKIWSDVTELDLSSHELLDISPLAELTKITSLNLSSSRIRDITPLQALSNLTTLDLRNNHINDITPLSSLANLSKLYLWSNEIHDVSPLSPLTNLTTLELGLIQINDISPLRSLTKLTTLVITSCGVNDITSLSQLTNLTVLTLNYNTITDITPLVSLTNLTEINIKGNAIEDITPLASLTNLRKLGLHNRYAVEPMSFSFEQIDVLQQALPDCEIIIR